MARDRLPMARQLVIWLGPSSVQAPEPDPGGLLIRTCVLCESDPRRALVVRTKLKHGRIEPGIDRQCDTGGKYEKTLFHIRVAENSRAASTRM